MRLHLSVKLKYLSITIILSVRMNYSVRDLLCDVISNDWPVKYRYVLRMVNDVSAFSGISSTYQAVNSIRLWFVWNLLSLHIFSCCFWLSITILSYVLILPVWQNQTQQPMTPQISTRIEYLTQTYNILVLNIYLEITKKSILTVCFFKYWWMMILDSDIGLLFGIPVSRTRDTFDRDSSSLRRTAWLNRGVWENNPAFLPSHLSSVNLIRIFNPTQ